MGVEKTVQKGAGWGLKDGIGEPNFGHACGHTDAGMSPHRLDSGEKALQWTTCAFGFEVASAERASTGSRD